MKQIKIIILQDYDDYKHGRHGTVRYLPPGTSGQDAFLDWLIEKNLEQKRDSEGHIVPGMNWEVYDLEIPDKIAPEGPLV